jgi:ABC-2 type transport system ATP-binding protein
MTIAVRELVVRFGSQPAVDGVSFDVAAGQVMALLGPNGAGKTTIVETIEGYRSPDEGTVRVLGSDPVTSRSGLTHRWGVMPQAPGLPMGLTVGEVVELYAALHGSRERTDAIVDATGLGSLRRRRWRKLSGGEQQRVSLALALCGGSEVLLLDEPTAAVDAAGRERILELITDRASAGAAVLITTHRFDDVERVADRVVIIDRGRTVAAGTLADLTSTNDRIEFRARPGLDRANLRVVTGLIAGESPPGRYVIDVVPTPASVAALNQWLGSQGVMAESMLVGRRTLESVFSELTGSEGDQPDRSLGSTSDDGTGPDRPGR